MRKTTSNLKIELIPIDKLKPYKNNPRTHNKDQIQKLARSIEQFGFNSPILINKHNVIICGHGRYEAAKLIALDKVPVIKLEHLSESDAKAFGIADNQIALLSDWDEETLGMELQELAISELDFNLEITGLETPKIDEYILKLVEDEKPETPELVYSNPNRDIPPISKEGDLWLLSVHKLLCGNAQEEKSYEQLLGDEKVRLTLTDPPYNVAIAGNVSGLGKVKHGNFVMGNGELSEQEFITFLETVMNHTKTFSVDGALSYWCMDWKHPYELLTASRNVFDEHKNTCIWNKSTAGMGSFYRSKYEAIYIFKCGKAKHINNIQLGRFGRNRSNVWNYDGYLGLGSDRDIHPTVKPLEMIKDAILDVTRLGDLVLDPFLGSGTTMIAAEKTGRIARCIELDPYYVDAAIRRFESATGIKAIHSETGEAFSDLDHTS